MNFLQLFGQGCRHRLSWPRVTDNGRHYQICLACGTVYEYDWKAMRRTGRVLAALTGKPSEAPSRLASG